MADVHRNFAPSTDSEVQMMSERMMAFIFPNRPRTQPEKEAFNKAVMYQIEHEKTISATLGEELAAMPDGTTSFTIGTFSMSFGANGYRNGAVLTKETVCPYAYSVLLTEGLLYKGVITRGDTSCL